MRSDDNKLYPNRDFVKAFGKSKDEVREIVRKKLEAVNFNKEVLEDNLQWGEFIFDMMFRDGSEKEWAEQHDMSDWNTAFNYVWYMTTD